MEHLSSQVVQIDSQPNFLKSKPAAVDEDCLALMKVTKREMYYVRHSKRGRHTYVYDLSIYFTTLVNHL